jgi:hypothetical protein
MIWHDIITHVAFVLGVVSTALHFVAPRTKNTVDDRAAAVVDDIKKQLELIAAAQAAPKAFHSIS